MSLLEQVQSELASLEEQAAELYHQGDHLQGVRLEKTPAGGTASINAKLDCKYARLRAGRGKLLPNGKKSQYVPLGQIEHYEAAIARGKTLTRLEKQIAKLKQKIVSIHTQAARLGIDLLDH
ncbi:MAG: hypothetical protein AAFW84_19890 [Cyanobacteria bacterium J06635_15]